MKVGVVVVAALILTGAASAGATLPQWTPRTAETAARALGFPTRHPSKVTCRGVGAPSNGLYWSFKCRRGHHRFTIASDSTGWVKANGRYLSRGFVSTGELRRLGGFSQSAPDAAGPYVLRKYGTVGSFNCTNPAGHQWTCVFQSPAVTVTITYRKAKGGWLLTAK